MDLPDPLDGPLDERGEPVGWRTYRLPEECSEVAEITCGGVSPAFMFRWCLGAQKTCRRAALPSSGSDAR